MKKKEDFNIKEFLKEFENVDFEKFMIPVSEDEALKYNNDEAYVDESFSERMNRCGTDLTKLRAEYKKFCIWFDGMLENFDIHCRNKIMVCRALADNCLLISRDDDAARLWCICMSGYSDFVFSDPSENDEKYALFNFMGLTGDIEKMMNKIRTELNYKEEFRRLSANITFCKEPCIDYDFSDIINILTKNASGNILRDNLSNALDMISRSPELSRVVPLVLYSLMIRKPTKMRESYGYVPNFNSVLSEYEYIIDRDNGKNISDLYRQLDLYKLLMNRMDFCDKKLCDTGFACISNIVGCELIIWEDYPMIERPLVIEAKSDIFFSCFPGGYMDNPYYSEIDLDLNYLDAYEEHEMSLPEKSRVLKKAAAYIEAHEEIAKRYIDMIEKNETDRCVSLIFEVINNSGIDIMLIKPNHVDIVFSLIMKLIMEDIDRRVKAEMIRHLEIIMSWYEDVELPQI